MTEHEQLSDIYALCRRLERDGETNRLRLAAAGVLADAGTAELSELHEAAKNTQFEDDVRRTIWAAWNRR